MVPENKAIAPYIYSERQVKGGRWYKLLERFLPPKPHSQQDWGSTMITISFVILIPLWALVIFKAPEYQGSVFDLLKILLGVLIGKLIS
jgi:hypothetical protein